MNMWMRIGEGLPEERVRVLCFRMGSNDDFWIAFRESGDWVDAVLDCGLEGVTHWMPLPSPPE